MLATLEMLNDVLGARALDRRHTDVPTLHTRDTVFIGALPKPTNRIDDTVGGLDRALSSDHQKTQPRHAPCTLREAIPTACPRIGPSDGFSVGARCLSFSNVVEVTYDGVRARRHVCVSV